VSLGCQNQVDSKSSRTSQHPAGALPTTRGSRTSCEHCSFIESAAEESVRNHRELGSSRKSGPAQVGGHGCLPGAYREKIIQALGSGFFLGTGAFDQCEAAGNSPIAHEAVLPTGTRLPGRFYQPRLLSAGTWRNLKIAEGCSQALHLLHHPKLRGIQKRPPEDVAAEAAELVAAGVKEWCWWPRTPPLTAWTSHPGILGSLVTAWQPFLGKGGNRRLDSRA